MGKPKTRHSAKDGARAHPADEEPTREKLVREESVDEQYEEAVGDEQSVEETDEVTEDHRPKDQVSNPAFQFSSSKDRAEGPKGVQPSKRHVRNREASQYCVRMSVVQDDDEEGMQPPPKHAWNEALIYDIVQPWVQAQITEVKITIHGKAILFFGRRTEGQGLTWEQAREVSLAIPRELRWVG